MLSFLTKIIDNFQTNINVLKLPQIKLVEIIFFNLVQPIHKQISFCGIEYLQLQTNFSTYPLDKNKIRYL